MSKSVRQGKRSDSVRARRSKRKPKKAVRARARGASVASRTIPPMVARGGGMVTLPAPSKSRKEARRRYNVALGNTGAEVRLPALPRVRFGWRLASGILVALLLTAIYNLWSSPEFTVQAAEIVGIERITSLEINHLLSVTGESIFVVEPHELQKTLEDNFPELVDVSVRVAFPANVVVEAGERQPRISWEQAGLVVWVDTEGVPFMPRGEVTGLVPVHASDSPPVRKVEEGEIQPLLPPEMVSAILTLSTVAPDDTVLAYDPQHGLGWDDARGWTVFFGPSPKDMHQRLAVYDVVVEELTKQNITPAIINLEYFHAPFYRLEP